MHVDSGDAAEGSLRNVPRHCVVAKVGQWVTECGKFPVKYRKDARLSRMKDQVIQAEVPVNDANHRFRLGHGWNMFWQPLDQRVHFWNCLGDGRLVLLAPARYLSLEVIAGATVSCQTLAGKVDQMQSRDDAVHFFINRPTLRRLHSWQRLVPKNASFDEFHDVEGAADHRLIFTKAQHLRYRNLGAGQSSHDGKFSLYRVSGWEQFCDWPRFGTHHVAALRRDELVRWVALPTFKGLYR